MNPALQAHLRILAQTPRERIRTHEQRSADRFYPGSAEGDLPQRRRATIAEALGAINPETGKRWLLREIAEALGISKTSVCNHVRAMKKLGLLSKLSSDGVSGKRGFPVVIAETCRTGEAVRSVRDVESAFAAMRSKSTQVQRNTGLDNFSVGYPSAGARD